MTVIKKLIDKFKNSPESLKFKDIEIILINLDFEKVQTKGSHVKFKRFNFKNDIIVPVHNSDCIKFYKKQIYKQIKNLL